MCYMFNGHQFDCGVVNGEDGAPRVLATEVVEPERYNIVECHVCCQQFADAVSLASHDCIPTLQVRDRMPSSRVKSKDVNAYYRENSSLTGFSNNTVSSASYPFKCPTCHLTYSRSVDFAHHKCSSTSGTPRYRSAEYDDASERSDVAPSTYQQANSYSNSLGGHHTEQSYEGDNCHRKFDYLRSLLKDRPTDTHQSYVCDVCHKAFARLRHLQAHKRLHSGTELYICNTCAEAFTTSGELRSHKCSDSGGRWHVCDVCDKSFAYFHHLQDHKRLHFGTNLYLCDICTKAFATSSDLDKHKRCHKSYVSDMRDKTCADFHRKRVHSGTRTFVCNRCTKVFTTSFELIRHKLSHSCFTMYPCGVCGQAFLQQPELKEHKKMHSH